LTATTGCHTVGAVHLSWTILSFGLGNDEAMTGIFISYRRADTSGYAGRLYDDLTRRFDADGIFHDVDTMPPGVDFVDAITQVLDTCSVLLALIGPSWLTIADGERRRIDQAADLVRVEIATALKRNVPVIPVLVQGSVMPHSRDLPKVLRGLARRNAIELTDSRWRYDVGRLISAIEQLGDGTPGAPLERALTRTGADEPVGDQSIRGVSILDHASAQGSSFNIQVGHTFKRDVEQGS
jgi:TIR domain